MKADQFTEDSLRDMEFSDTYACSFSGAMVSTCEPLFDDCGSNYDVEKKLKSAGVIPDGALLDSESCSLVVLFKSWAQGRVFIKRFNRYLTEKTERLEAARDY